MRHLGIRLLRQSAVWGKRSGDTRSSATWGKKGSRGTASLLAVLALALALSGPASAKDHGAFLTEDLYEDASEQPRETFDVIVQSRDTATAAALTEAVAAVDGRVPGAAVGLRRKLHSIDAVAAELTGSQLVRLATRPGVIAISLDAPVVLTSFSNNALWTKTAGVEGLWEGVPAEDAPTIAIVDSGIEADRADFASGRVLAEVDLTSLVPNSDGDGRGHGTLVAGVAAGSADGHAGAAPTVKIVAIDVMNDKGKARTSDVIRAAEWILANKDVYDIRVANFSLHSSVPTSFMFDPLDKAVERLWFSGVVVVAPAGNYSKHGRPTRVRFAPGNDPFVITVGAADTNGTPTARDDFNAPWSTFGYTLDGFAKPELGAPGRQIIGPVPADSTMALERPDRLVEPGYMWMSGTSFSAAIVSGAAASIIARHPEWTPDQVKGALMRTAQSTRARRNALGVGEIDAAAASLVAAPPNPNAALNEFVEADPAGGSVPVFDAASWASAAKADASWASASWASASWASASWAAASWASASWASASWASASWASASWAAASWAAASWAAASWANASWAAASWVE